MASTIPTCFFPQSLAKTKTKNTPNPRKPSLPKKLFKSNPNPKHRNRRTHDFPPPFSSVPGGDATTYTRLPPKDDFFLSPFDPFPPPPTEIKLSESTTPTQNIPSNEIELGNDDDDEEEEEEESFDRNLGFDYGKFELFEVNSDPESEDDEEEIDYEGEGGEIVFNGEEGIEDEEEVKEKEKGVPAVMRCFDRAKIYVKAGDGGNGVVAFRREKYVPFGGPSGGDGGRGGNVYVEVDGSMNSLLPFRQNIHFRAGRGYHGQGKKQNGARGEDVVVKVAPGTVIREAGEGGDRGEVLLELLNPGQRALLLPGGRGGRGNASFKSGTNKVPKIAENGEEGPEM